MRIFIKTEQCGKVWFSESNQKEVNKRMYYFQLFKQKKGVPKHTF